MVSLITHTSIIIQTEQFVVRNIYVSTYMHLRINEREAMSLKDIKEGYMEMFGGRQRRGEMM